MFTNPTGTQDILPAEWPYWDYVLDAARAVAELYGYRRIETPTFGPTALFARTTGEGTDIVDKEMYSFTDRSGDSLTLRPEGTAQVMRAYLQHGMHKLPQPVKLFYIERIYRAERPQRGRYREHHQFGCEAIGVEDPLLDVEVISLLNDLYHRLGLQNISLTINSIGDHTCRPGYISALLDYLRTNEDRLCSTCRERMERNPLRVLDCKQAGCQPVLNSAPRLTDFLCERCRGHWGTVRSGLDALGITYAVNPRLVRGLDYYTDTVFEFVPPFGGEQAVIGGGGRYDALSQAMGGPAVPGVGFGSGLERLILNLKEQDIEAPPSPAPRVYVAHAGEGTENCAQSLAALLRRAGVATEMAFGSRSLRAQMKAANSSGALYVAIVGEEEVAEGSISVRRLDTGEQSKMLPADLLTLARD